MPLLQEVLPPRILWVINKMRDMEGAVLPMDEKALSGLQARMERLKSGTMEHL
ncbi:hypothetical protein Pint_11469 [Pistacia integerrima]|uniref:Uncharacterized protein n=1 Tax=Pistacia integerrima TaxID=434235 RepID=A0ACC0XGL7_9ROSI|nr:hypothetical protein Pint_11469 [Pistacia integerrima]